MYQPKWSYYCLALSLSNLENTYYYHFIGTLHQISSTESWNEALKRSLKGLPSSLLSLTTTQLSSLIILVIFLSMLVLHMWVNNNNNNKSSQIKVEGEVEGGYVHPLNCVHGYVNLDAAGNLLDKNSKQPPR